MNTAKDKGGGIRIWQGESNLGGAFFQVEGMSKFLICEEKDSPYPPVGKTLYRDAVLLTKYK